MENSTTPAQTLGDFWVGDSPPSPEKVSDYWWSGQQLHVFDGNKWSPVPPPRPLRFLTYLAGPYSSKSVISDERAAIQLRRFNILTLAAVMLTQAKRWNVFSPITHSHPMHEMGLAGDWEFWKKIDTEYVLASERLVVVTLDGWETSTGVTAEIGIAKDTGIPIWHMTEPEQRNGKWTAWLTDNHTGEYLTYDIPVK